MTEWIELLNQQKIRKLGENYSGILQAVTIKQAEVKKILKEISGEQENYLKPNYLSEL